MKTKRQGLFSVIIFITIFNSSVNCQHVVDQPIQIVRGSGGQSSFITVNHDPWIWSTTNTPTLPYPFRDSDLGHLVIQPRTSAPRDILFVTGDGDDIRMAIKGNGNIGIGTTALTDNYKFTIKENISSSGYGFRILNADESRSAQIWVGTGGAVFDAEGITNLHIRTGGVDRLFINSSGKIGIGTTLPDEKLDINNGNILMDYNYKLFWANSNNFFGAEAAGVEGLKIVYGGGINMIIDSDNSGTSSSFSVKKDNTSAESAESLFEVKESGNAVLYGKFEAKEIKVQLAPTADFVFNDDYKLKKIREVESFIKENKHLPDFPSAKEIEENGINVGEMDAKLLQKIEELTLYIIEQNKKIEDLQVQLNGLKK